MPEGPVRAAGAVLWRPGADGIEVALVHRPKYDDWTFPKGKFNDDEHMLHAAVREVWEETGVWPVLGRRLSAREYDKDGGRKHVDYWAATGEDGEFQPDDEVDRVDWLPAAKAERRLTYPRDADLLREFLAGPLRTVPYVIVRHTSAGDKRDWVEDDLLRPLDARGRAEALALAEVLACYGPARVISSVTARCLETVLPYATRVGREPRTDWAFTVGAAKNPGDRFTELLAEQMPTLVCTHGELVPELIVRACAELGADPPEDPRLSKGGFAVLHTADGALTALERHRM